MKLVFEKTYDNELIVYVHFDSVASYHKFQDKIHIHSEYDTEFSEKLSEWSGKKYYHHISEEPLVGHSNVIYQMRFFGASHPEELKKELVNYFTADGICGSGCYEIEYKWFK